MTTDRRIRPAELALAVCLYALQGVVVAYLLNFNKAYMIAGGVNDRTAGRVETAVSNLSVVGDALFLDAVHLWHGQYRPVLLVSAALVLGLLAMVRPLSRLRSKEPAADADL